MDWSDYLEQKLLAMFPESARRDAAEAELARYGVGDHEPEAERVRTHVRAAKGDYRDVLAWAEYPAQVKANSWRLPDHERERLRLADLAQYAAWLEQGEG